MITKIIRKQGPFKIKKFKAQTIPKQSSNYEGIMAKSKSDKMADKISTLTKEIADLKKDKGSMPESEIKQDVLEFCKKFQQTDGNVQIQPVQPVQQPVQIQPVQMQPVQQPVQMQPVQQPVQPAQVEQPISEFEQENEKYKSRLNSLNQRISNLEQVSKPVASVSSIPPPAVITQPQQFIGGSPNKKMGGYLQYGAGNKSKKIHHLVKSLRNRKIKNRSKHNNIRKHSKHRNKYIL